MVTNQKAENLISIMIIIVIISIAFLSLSRIIEYDNNINADINKSNIISILEKNAISIVTKIDTSWILENEVFYISQSWSEIKTMTWNTNYQYINSLWENIDITTYIWIAYSRSCILDKGAPYWQNIKCTLKEIIKNK